MVSNWNTGAEAIKGYKASEIVGQHFSRFYTEEDRARGEPRRALATALAEGKYEKEAWRLRKDGSRFWASVVIDPVHDEQGRLLGFAKITRDITERRRANEELEEARAALFQSQKLQALGELTGGVAHDFNNLMTVIRGSAELLTRPGLSEEKRVRYLQAILDTADRASTLTSHLLAFGRRQALKPEVADLNLRLDAFAEMVGRTLGGQFEVKLDLAPSLPPVEVDLAQLETALLNAAFNARDAMPEGGRLTSRHPPSAGRRRRRGDGGDRRHRQRDERRGARPRLRAFLHHQAGRRGDRPRPLADPRLRGPGGRPRRDTVRPGRRDGGAHHPSRDRQGVRPTGRRPYAWRSRRGA